MEGQSAQLVFFHHRCRFHRARNSQPDRAAPQAPGLAVLSGPDGAGAAGVVGAGGEPQLSSAACRDVRRPGALLDLPGAGDGGQGVLSAAGQRRAAHVGAHRGTAGRPAGVSVAPGGRYFGRAPGANGAAGLSGGGSATQPRARDRRAVLRLP